MGGAVRGGGVSLGLYLGQAGVTLVPRPPVNQQQQQQQQRQSSVSGGRSSIGSGSSSCSRSGCSSRHKVTRTQVCADDSCHRIHITAFAARQASCRKLSTPRHVCVCSAGSKAVQAGSSNDFLLSAFYFSLPTTKHTSITPCLLPTTLYQQPTTAHSYHPESSLESHPQQRRAPRRRRPHPLIYHLSSAAPPSCTPLPPLYSAGGCGAGGFAVRFAVDL